jgi:hypothetical protein
MHPVALRKIHTYIHTYIHTRARAPIYIERREQASYRLGLHFNCWRKILVIFFKKRLDMNSQTKKILNLLLNKIYKEKKIK